MRVLVADRINEDGIQKLRDMGCQVIHQPDASGPSLVQAVADSACQILVVRGTKVNGDALRATKELSLVVRVGSGFDSIDVAAASAGSIFVSNCPGKNAAAVAELTFGLILALDRRIPDNTADLRKGVWAKKKYSKARGLKGRTLGIIGVGQIGALVAKRALAFEMDVVGWSRSLTSEKASELGMVRLDLPEEVAATCDVLTVHLASSRDTHHFIGQNIFDELRPHSYFINTSRSDVVDYKALAKAVTENHIRVGLDVYEKEPAAHEEVFSDDIVHLDGVVYGTHHIGASTDEAQEAAAEEMVNIIRDYIRTGHVHNCVNLSSGKLPQSVLVVRQRNIPGVLAKVLTTLGKHSINVREMENVICDGEQNACSQIRLDCKPEAAVLEEIVKADPENILGVTMTQPRF